MKHFDELTNEVLVFLPFLKDLKSFRAYLEQNIDKMADEVEVRPELIKAIKERNNDELVESFRSIFLCQAIVDMVSSGVSDIVS